jgi:hypothetical protein
MLAFGLNDSKEKFRVELLQKLEKPRPELRNAILKTISCMQMARDPRSGYPCVAAKDYLNTLPASARECNRCKKPIQEGYDIIWKACRQHVFHRECIRTAEWLLTSICDCVAN